MIIDTVPDLRNRSEGAQELAEFAIVVPLLLLFLFGAVDLGRLFHAAITIANAAREGARYISLNYDDPDIGGRNQAVLEAQGAGITITTDDVTVNCPRDADNHCQRMQPVQVTVTYDFELLLGPVLFDYILPGPTLTLQRTAEMLVQ